MEQENPIEYVEEHIHEPRFGGYDFMFVDELLLAQTCSICLLAMRNPVQTICGHRFCEDCLLGTFRQSNERVCPQDRNRIPEDGGFFRDVAWEREILSLRVECKRIDLGCTWIGELRHYESHFNLCEYEEIGCDDCDEEMQRRFLALHMRSLCRNRIVRCKHCSEEFPFWRLKDHRSYECTRFPLQCPQQCGVQDIPREEVESHVRDDCFMTVVVCPYGEAGCTFHDKRFKLKDHLDEFSEDHLSKTWSELLKTKRRLIAMEKIRAEVEILQTEKESMEATLERTSEEVSELKLSEKKLEVENMTLRKNVAELGRQHAQLQLTSSNEQEESRSLKQLVQTMEIQNMDLRKELTALKCQVDEIKGATNNQKKERSSLKQLNTEVTELRRQLGELKLAKNMNKQSWVVWGPSIKEAAGVECRGSSAERSLWKPITKWKQIERVVTMEAGKGQLPAVKDDDSEDLSYEVTAEDAEEEEWSQNMHDFLVEDAPSTFGRKKRKGRARQKEW